MVKNLRYEFQPNITEEQLWDFYVRNDICEVGYGKDVALLPLKHNPYIVAVFSEEKLVGIIRALFDGLSACIMEFCLECELQGEDLELNNGSVIEKDQYEIAGNMGKMLIAELEKLGNTFTTAYIVEGMEEEVYKSIGLKHNEGHLVYYKDVRPYVNE
jgi:hypothetical protein